MTRLFLATALVLQLSGVAAAAVVACTQPGMTVRNCCCHHERSDRESPSGLPVVAPTCPCTMAPPSGPPVTQTPVTLTAARSLVATPAVLASTWHATYMTASLATRHPVFADTGPPPVSASHLRC